MIGIGLQEIIVLLGCGGFFAVGGVVLFVVLSARSKRERELEDENRELRRRLDDDKDSGQ